MSLVVVAGSAVWLLVLTLFPAWRASGPCLAVSLGWLVLGLVVSVVVLLRHKRLLFLVNLLQISLFGLVFAQLEHTLGVGHFHAHGAPLLFDWHVFAWSQALSAADLVHLLAGYGLRLHPIEPRSVLAATLVWGMRLAVSIFVVGLLLRWIAKRWRRNAVPLAEKWRERRRWDRMLGQALAAVLVAIAWTAFWQGWRALDWLLWPLDSFLRVFDAGGALEVFHVRLHAVPRDPWAATLGLALRVLLGARLLSALRACYVRWLGSGAPQPLDDFIEQLDHGDEKVRQAAAQALAAIGPDAAEAAPRLVQALADESGPVGAAARVALEALGPPRAEDVAALLAEVDHANWAVRRAAIAGLGRLGPRALSAVPKLVERLVDEDRLTESYAAEALARIYPGWSGSALVAEAIPRLVRRLNHADRRVRQGGADVLGRLGPLARSATSALRRALTDGEEYVRLSAEWALDAIDPDWRRRQALEPLLAEVGEI